MIPAVKNSLGEELPELALRPPRASDRDAVADMLRDPETARWIDVPVPFTDAHVDTYLTMAPRDWDRGWPRWFVTEADSDTMLGTVGLRRKRHDTAEIRFQTAPWARGRSVAVRSAHAAALYAFEAMGTKRLTWDAFVGNQLSRLVAMRLGFRMEGTARQAATQRGTRVDCWTGALLPGELRGIADPPPDYPLLRRQALAWHGQRPQLETEIAGLRLRPPGFEDVDAIMATCVDPETARWTTVPQPYERAHAEGFVAVHAAGNWRAATMAVFALADADGYCGAIDLRIPAPGATSGEVGFSASPWVRGRGYMTAALRAVCRYGFDVFGLERIEWRAFVGNLASRRVAEKAGFTIEGTLRMAGSDRGKPVDEWVGSLLRAEM